MSKVGIIANPAAGKDIRRLVAYATVTDNVKKTGIVRRAILALDATGVDEILIMPDYYNLGGKALDGIRQHELKCRVSFLEMPVSGDAEESKTWIASSPWAVTVPTALLPTPAVRCLSCLYLRGRTTPFPFWWRAQRQAWRPASWPKGLLIKSR
jgi:hypothetical protein